MIDLLTEAWVGLLPLAAAAPDAAGKQASNPLFQSLLFIGVMFFILYFLMIRPQRKRQRERTEMLEAVKKGDKIITRGGIHGVITLVRDKDVVVKVDDNVKLTLSKAGVAAIVPEEGKDAGKSQG